MKPRPPPRRRRRRPCPAGPTEPLPPPPPFFFLSLGPGKINTTKSAGSPSIAPVGRSLPRRKSPPKIKK
jgi:hypothetical protein